MSEKTLLIDDKEYVATYTGATARLYRNMFHEDLLAVVNQKQREFVAQLLNYSNARVELNQEEVTAVLIDTIGAETLEKITWAVIATTYRLKGRNFMGYEKFMDSIIDYPSFVGICVVAYEMIAYANQPTVEALEDEKEDKKKESTEEMTSSV